jgi:hypothetical protein
MGPFPSDNGVSSEQPQELPARLPILPLLRRWAGGRTALAPVLLVAGLGVADREHRLLVLPPDPIADRWGVAQIGAAEPEPQPLGGLQQHIQHRLAITAAGQGLVGALGAVEGFHKQADPLDGGQRPQVAGA